jgi:hypothetical protein
MRKYFVVLLVALVALAVASVASSRPLTTTPGTIYVLKTRVDDTGIHIPKDKFTKNGITRYPRGAQIRYVFMNEGSKPYSIFMWAAATLPIKPHGKATMFLNWQYRGTYSYYRKLHGKKIGPVGTIIIF